MEDMKTSEKELCQGHWHLVTNTAVANWPHQWPLQRWHGVLINEEPISASAQYLQELQCKGSLYKTCKLLSIRSRQMWRARRLEIGWCHVSWYRANNHTLRGSIGWCAYWRNLQYTWCIAQASISAVKWPLWRRIPPVTAADGTMNFPIVGCAV